jgi:hypothetical protein
MAQPCGGCDSENEGGIAHGGSAVVGGGDPALAGLGEGVLLPSGAAAAARAALKFSKLAAAVVRAADGCATWRVFFVLAMMFSLERPVSS